MKANFLGTICLQIIVFGFVYYPPPPPPFCVLAMLSVQ